MRRAAAGRAERLTGLGGHKTAQVRVSAAIGSRYLDFIPEGVEAATSCS